MRKYVQVVLSSIALTHCGVESSAPGARRSHDPTQVRVPARSRALSLEEDWVPPAPTVSREGGPVNRRQDRRHEYGAVTDEVPWFATDAEMRRLSGLPDALVPVPGLSSPLETIALRTAVATYRRQADAESVGPLVQFVERHPSSRWAPIVLLNLGTISYDTGRFLEALKYWRSAWDTAKNGDDAISRRIANLALAEVLKMNARVGRKDAIDAGLREAQGRHFMGDARLKMGSALQGRWYMEHKPGESFRCGPYALSKLATRLNPESKSRIGAMLARAVSPPEGFSLTQVAAMAPQLGIEVQMAKRESGALVLPAVVHWKVGHFAALVRELNGKILVEDPTFGNRVWMSPAAIDAEASGYYLVAAGELQPGWRTVSSDEGGRGLWAWAFRKWEPGWDGAR